ncbi:MAG: TolC family protein [Wenzhouxiangellaceae bacterium]
MSLPLVAGAQETLDFATVMVRSLQASPDLIAHQAVIRAAVARIEQAGYRPNPSLNLNMEDLIGSGVFDGFNRSEVTLSYQQKFERGGKRAARVHLAEQQQQLAEIERALALVDLIYAVEVEYRQLQARQAVADVHARQVELAQSVYAVVKQRRDRGRDSDVTLDNAEIRRLLAQAKADQALSELTAARAALSQRWADMPQGPLPLEMASFEQLPDASTLNNELDPAQNPTVERWRIVQHSAEAEWRLARADSVQDPTVSAGLRYLQETQDVALVAGVTLPLTLHHNNRGNQLAARAEAEAASGRYEQALVNNRRELTRLNGEARATLALAHKLSGQLLSRAEAAEKAVLERMRQGAASDLDVYAAQSLAADLRLQLIRTREQFHILQAQRDRLNGHYWRRPPAWLQAWLTQTSPVSQEGQ